VSRLDNLPPDLRAALALVLGQRKSYAELATLLGIEPRAVHDRAHAALALLAPLQARALSGTQREQVGEYLLGQQDTAGRGETRAQLERSEPARIWARALAGELGPLAPQGLPEIPAASNGAAPLQPAAGPAAATTAVETGAGAATAATAHPAGPTPAGADASAPASAVSQRGGAILLGAIAVVVVVAVLLIVGVGGGGGGSHAGTTGASAKNGSTSASKSAGNASATTTPSGATGSTGIPSSAHSKALPLTPPNPSTSKALGVAYVLSQKGQRAFYVFSKGLPTPAAGTFYAVWLEGSANSPDYPLGSLPAAGSDGLIEGGGPLPSNAATYTRIIVTVETTHKPTNPGPTVLGGKFSLS